VSHGDIFNSQENQPSYNAARFRRQRFGHAMREVVRLGKNRRIRQKGLS
jgi:hypothetical protein